MPYNKEAWLTRPYINRYRFRKPRGGYYYGWWARLRSKDRRRPKGKFFADKKHGGKDIAFRRARRWWTNNFR